MTPVVGKALEATIVVLFIGLVATTLYGGAVPAYRTTAGAAIADRTLADAAAAIQDAVPPGVGYASVRITIDLPATIVGGTYRLRIDGTALALRHPNPGIGGRTPLVLPADVQSVTGSWSSGDAAEVRVSRGPAGLEVELA